MHLQHLVVNYLIPINYHFKSYKVTYLNKTFIPLLCYVCREGNIMTSIKAVLKCPLICLILISGLFSCMQQSGMGVTGVLKGKITIGPLCPVETIPPDPACSPTLQTYKTWATAVWKPDKKTKLVTLNPTIDGNYLIAIPAGDYIIDFDTIKTYKAGSDLPARIAVLPNDTTIFNISIDTGIR